MKKILFVVLFTVTFCSVFAQVEDSKKEHGIVKVKYYQDFLNFRSGSRPGSTCGAGGCRSGPSPDSAGAARCSREGISRGSARRPRNTAAGRPGLASGESWLRPPRTRAAP